MDELASFLDGTEDPATRDRIERHLALCGGCFDLVSEAARILVRLEETAPAAE